MGLSSTKKKGKDANRWQSMPIIKCAGKERVIADVPVPLGPKFFSVVEQEGKQIVHV